MEYKIVEKHAHCGEEDDVEYTLSITDMDSDLERVIARECVKAVTTARMVADDEDVIIMSRSSGNNGSCGWYEIEVSGMTREMTYSLVKVVEREYQDHLAALRGD